MKMNVYVSNNLLTTRTHNTGTHTTPFVLASAPSKPEPVSTIDLPQKAPSPVFSVSCPMHFTPVDVPEDGIYGLKRLTRNPTFWILGLYGLATALNTPLAAEVSRNPMIRSLSR
jgi:hypothetical protein